ncbi:MAG: hypothetical protein MUO26_09150 [Methanotrichaceae archaeon]|nr:hypothetical protein [Methanotrichaceae archaeon]
MLLPFLVASILQLAQGSRVVTAVVSSQMLSGYPLDGLILALLISAGAFMFSYMTDPYFWLIKESVGSGTREVLYGYTIPLSLMGIVTFIIVSLYWTFL